MCVGEPQTVVCSLTKLSVCESLLLTHEEKLTRLWQKATNFSISTHNDFICTGRLTNLDITTGSADSEGVRGLSCECVFVVAAAFGLHSSHKVIHCHYFLCDVFFYSWHRHASPYFSIPLLLHLSLNCMCTSHLRRLPLSQKRSAKLRQLQQKHRREKQWLIL